MTRYYDDYNIGDSCISSARTITEGEISILLGIGRYSHPLFIDEEYAKTTSYKGRIVPGQLIIFMLGPMAHLMDKLSIIAAVSTDNVKFLKPVRAGDTLHVEASIFNKRVTSKPEVGLIFHRQICKNQNGETVAEYDEIHMVHRKVT
jgi:acyl dehydratase